MADKIADLRNNGRKSYKAISKILGIHYHTARRYGIKLEQEGRVRGKDADTMYLLGCRWNFNTLGSGKSRSTTWHGSLHGPYGRRKLAVVLWEQQNGPVPSMRCLKLNEGADPRSYDPADWHIAPKGYCSPEYLERKWAAEYAEKAARSVPGVEFIGKWRKYHAMKVRSMYPIRWICHAEYGIVPKAYLQYFERFGKWPSTKTHRFVDADTLVSCAMAVKLAIGRHDRNDPHLLTSDLLCSLESHIAAKKPKRKKKTH